MTNTTTTTVIEMVINAGVNTAAEIEAFVVGLGRNITVPMLDEALDQLFVAHTSRQTKAVKINLFARALEMDIDTEDLASMIQSMREPQSEVEVEADGALSVVPAAGETPVAEENQKEEVHTMNEQQQVNYQNQRALENSALLKKAEFGVMTHQRLDGLTKEVQGMLDRAESSKDNYFRNIGEFNVRVENIIFYPEADEATRQEINSNKVVRTISGVNKNGQPWEQTTIGEIELHIPKEYMQIKFYNKRMPNPYTGQMGCTQWLDFNGYDDEGNRVAYDADFTKPRNNSRKPAEGTGRLILPIRLGKDGKPYVSLPMDADKTGKNGGKPYPVFKTADVRYINSKNARFKDESMYVADNNNWFNAQVTAYVQAYTNEFEQENLCNIHAIEKLCTTCSHSVRLFQRDELNGDLDTSRKSRAVQEPLTILDLAQVGSNQPSVVCGLDRQYKDIKPTLELNDAEQQDKGTYQDEEGNTRYVGHNQYMIGGKPTTKAEHRAQGTKSAAEPCIHYHGNTPKSEAKVAAERAKAREEGRNDYIPPFYKEWAKVERQQIQVLVNVEGKNIWIPKFPGEVEKPLAMRVKSAGLNVIGAKHVFKFVDKEFVAGTKAEDVRHNDVMKKINQIFYAAFNMWKLDEAQAEAVFELADNKPEDITDAESEKWDTAVYWLAQAIVRAQEREEAKRYPAFVQHFFTTRNVMLQFESEDGTITEEPAELVEIDVQQVIGDFKESRKVEISMEDLVETGAVDVYDKDGNLIDHIEGKEAARFGKKGNGTYQALRTDYLNDAYDDLQASEFSRRLDDIAMDYVYSVITNGTRYVVVGDNDKDVELVAGALQDMLQKELTQNFYLFADGSRRDASLVSNVKRDADPAAALEALNVSEEVKDYIAELLGL